MVRSDTGDELRRLRAVAVVVSIVLFALLVLASVFGPAVNPNIRVSEAIFFSLSGTLILLLGIEGVVRVSRNGQG